MRLIGRSAAEERLGGNATRAGSYLRPLTSRRNHPARLALVLAGAVVAVDLLWSLVEGSTGSLAYGLIAAPAHLATCVVALLAVTALAGRSLPPRFVTAALIASVAIDVDHIPGYLGSHVLAGTLPRPYPHSLLLVLLLAALGGVSRRRGVREVSLGLAFGVSVHLFRDLATGPGVPLLWPLSDGVASLPYAYFALGLGLATLLALRGAPARRRSPARAGVLASVLALVLLIFGVGVSGVGAVAPRVGMGAYIPGSYGEPSLIDAYGAEVGSEPVIVSYYEDWTHSPIETAQLNAAWSRGAIPLLTWEPWSQRDPSVVVSLRAIASGAYDAYLSNAARAAAAWGHPIMLRFAHEMNGGWYPWGRGRNGNTAATYVAAWRHLVRIFRANGANNVKWVWTPYVSNGGALPFRRYFPGNRWVDWAGLDGLNGGSVFGWRPFWKIFAQSYRELVRMTPRPLMFAEVGSTEEGGNKAAWLSGALRQAVPRMPHIRAIVWWADGGDYRGNFGLNSSPAALAVLRAAASSAEYSASRAQLLGIPARLGHPHRHSRGRGHGKR